MKLNSVQSRCELPSVLWLHELNRPSRITRTSRQALVSENHMVNFNNGCTPTYEAAGWSEAKSRKEYNCLSRLHCIRLEEAIRMRDAALMLRSHNDPSSLGCQQQP